MSPTLQTILALTLVAACLAYVLLQGYRAMRGKRSRIGSCCAKGCDAASGATPSNAPKIVYMPVSMLSRKK